MKDAYSFDISGCIELICFNVLSKIFHLADTMPQAQSTLLSALESL
jgi:hypothetical protein